MLSGFRAELFPEDGPLVQCVDGSTRVFASIAREAIDDLNPGRYLNDAQRSWFVQANIEAFGRIISAKYAARERARDKSAAPRVVVLALTRDDLRESAETFWNPFLTVRLS